MTNDDVRAAFLAGDADGSELDAVERENLDRLRSRLADDAIWAPKQGGDVRSRLLAAASGGAKAVSAPEPAPIPEAIPSPERAANRPRPQRVEKQQVEKPANVVDLNARGDQSGRRGARIALQMMATAAAVFVAFWLGGQLMGEGADDTTESALEVTATHGLTPTALDPDATGSVLVMPTPAGVQLELQLMGLDNAEGPSYYAAWLLGPDGDAIELGTFHWRAGGVPIILWSGVDDPSYNQLIVTRQQQGDPPGRSDEIVLVAELPDLTAG